MEVLKKKGEPDFENRGFHNFLEKVLVLLLPFTTATTFWYILEKMDSQEYWIFLPAFLMGYFLADVITGIVHWLADTYGSPEMPILGPNFIEPFRWHHIEPKAMCKHSFFSTVGNTCFMAIPLQVFLMGLLSYTETNFWITCLAATLAVTSITTVMANQFHKWAHFGEDERPRWVTWLQKKRLILEPHHHNVHHTSPFTTYYCVTNGWANWILHTVRFWRILEGILACFGIRPDKTSKVSPESKEDYLAKEAEEK